MPDAIVVIKKDHLKKQPNGRTDYDYRSIIRDLEKKRIIRKVRAAGDIVYGRFYLSPFSIRRAYHKLKDKENKKKLEYIKKHYEKLKEKI